MFFFNYSLHIGFLTFHQHSEDTPPYPRVAVDVLVVVAADQPSSFQLVWILWVHEFLFYDLGSLQQR